MRCYFSMTAHTIIENDYKSYLLSFERLHGKHSGEALAAEFDRVVQLYNLDDKIVRLITDNASINLAAFDDIILPVFEDYFEEFEDDVSAVEGEGEEDNEENDEGTAEVDGSKHLHTGEVDEDEFLRLPCFCHCLQLVVNDGIKACGAVYSSLKRVADLAKLAHTSTIFAERLEKPHFNIRKANRTRWNSQFQTVKHAIAIPSSTLNSILTDLKKNDLILTTRDRKILEEFVSLFELFHEATVLTQDESYATIMVLLLLRFLGFCMILNMNFLLQL